MGFEWDVVSGCEWDLVIDVSTFPLDDVAASIAQGVAHVLDRRAMHRIDVSNGACKALHHLVPLLQARGLGGIHKFADVNPQIFNCCFV